MNDSAASLSTLITVLRSHDRLAADVMCALLRLPAERGALLVGAYVVAQTCEGSVEARDAAMAVVKGLVNEACAPESC